HRAVDHAWRILAPILNIREPNNRDLEFIGSLAKLSSKFGDPRARQASIFDAIRSMQPRVIRDPTNFPPLLALVVLVVHDAKELRVDPVPLLVQILGPCLEGKIPLGFAQELLSRLADELTEPISQLELCALLADRGFAAGLEVRELIR